MRALGLSLSVLSLSTAAAVLTLGGCEREIDYVNGGTVYRCSCYVVDDQNIGEQQIEGFWICADANNADSTCIIACSNHGGTKKSVGLPEGDCPAQGGSSSEGYELNGDEPNSSEAETDPGLSSAIVTLKGESQDVAMGGNVKFTGGCEGSSCEISFHQMSFTSDSFSVTVGEDSLLVSSVQILTVGGMVASQASDGSFAIPYDQIKLLINASVDGVDTPIMFYPVSGEDVYGYYVPSTGLFGLSGEFVSGADTVELDLNGEATSRPPVADAGSAQTVTANGNGFATVMLDGSGSYDLDDDLEVIRWFEGTTYLGSGAAPSFRFAIGDHTVTAAVFDSLSKKSVDTTVVRELAP